MRQNRIHLSFIRPKNLSFICHKPSMGRSAMHPSQLPGRPSSIVDTYAIYPSILQVNQCNLSEGANEYQTSTRAPHWDCLGIFKPDLSWGDRERFNDFTPYRLLIFLIAVLRRGDVTLLWRLCVTVGTLFLTAHTRRNWLSWNSDSLGQRFSVNTLTFAFKINWNQTL